MSCRFKTILIGLGCLGVVAAPTGEAAAQWTKINAQPTSSVALAFGNDAAYSDKSDVYLQVWGHPSVRARFVDANGNPLFGEFTVAQQSGSDAYARVEYSSGSADDVFLVTFSSEISGSQVFGRLVRYTTGGPQMSPPFRLSTTTGSSIQSAGGSAYDPVRRRFLATWQDIRGGWQIYGRFVYSSSFSTTGVPELSGGEQNLSATPFGQGTPNVAFDPEHNRYLVVFRGNAPDSPVVYGSWGRLLNEHGLLVDVNGDGTADARDVIELSRGGEPAEQNVIYLPEGDAFFTMWTEVGRTYDFMGRVVSVNGTTTSGILSLFASPGNEGMGDGAYSPTARKALVVFARDTTKFIEGLEINAVGIPLPPTFQVGSVVGREESRFPTVAAAEAGRFGLGYLNDYSASWFEVYHSTTAAGGGTTPPPPPPPPPSSPPPPPPPTLPLGSSTTLSTGSASLVWQHNEGLLSTWQLAGTNLVSGSGLSPARSSDPKWRVIATGRFNTDGHKDLLWQHDDGWLAVWLMNGNTLLSALLLTPGRVSDTNWRMVAAADINGDSLTDILWQHASEGWVAVWFMNGTVRVSEQLLSPGRISDLGWRIVGAADLNDDNWTDLIWQHLETGVVTSWLMYGATMVAPGVLSVNKSSDPYWRVRGVGDANGDGNPDLFWQHVTNNWLAVTILNGLTVVDSAWLNPQTVNSGWRLVGPR